MGNLPEFVDLESNWKSKRQQEAEAWIWQVKLEEKQFNPFTQLYKMAAITSRDLCFIQWRWSECPLGARQLLVRLDFLCLFTPYCLLLISTPEERGINNSLRLFPHGRQSVSILNAELLTVFEIRNVVNLHLEMALPLRRLWQDGFPKSKWEFTLRKNCRFKHLSQDLSSSNFRII